MTNNNNSSDIFIKNAVEAAIRIGVLALLVVWCFMIIAPFLIPVLWGMIIAVAVHPAYKRLADKLGGRNGLTAVLLSIFAIALLITPTIMLSGSLIDSAQVLSEGLEAGSLKVPPPPAEIAGWPLIGEYLHEIWTLASTNIEAAINKLGPQLKSVGTWLLSTGVGVGSGILQFVISIAIAGAFLANASSGNLITQAIAVRLAGQQGADFAKLAGATIRSVAQGVLGVALIQALLAGIGLMAVGVPAAGLWALLVLLLAIVQLPPILVLGPIIFYVFSVADTVPAVIFTIWSILVSASDAFLKPLFLGRGMEIPMLVILIGAIGGMMTAGIIGLFVGSVVLALGYTLLIAWLEGDPLKLANEAKNSE